MSDEVSTCNFEESFDKYLPSPGIELNAIVEDLKQKKMLVPKGKSPQPQKGSKLSNTFKPSKSLFKSRIANPMRVIKAIQTIGRAVHKAVATAASDFSVRAEKTIGLAAYGCVTTSLKGPVRPTDVMVPIMAISDDYHDQPDSYEVDTLALSCAAQIMNGDVVSMVQGSLCGALPGPSP
ncbi:other/FunK1 protein kinase [Coprinopsis cinerea AmutBmut pab1-1]|nr:other/FunK1 protein kinase [Coprinopsis cinerea AmutBmut pab1-1]